MPNVSRSGESEGDTPSHEAASRSENPELEGLFHQLDEEEEQEAEVRERDFLLDDVNATLLREREREYRDLEKHWVRKYGWMRAAQEVAEHLRQARPERKGLRYFTLPAYYRLDVSLLHSAGLLEVTRTDLDGRPEEIFVVGFESEPTKFGRMQGQNPRFKLLAPTTIEGALTDPDNAYYHQVRDLFPFDVINLDLTTSLTPRHEGPYSRTMEAIDQVLTLQAGYGLKWALFITFRNLPTDWEAHAIKQLSDNLQDNLNRFAEVRKAFFDRYSMVAVHDLAESDPQTCTSQAISKWIVDRAHQHRFRLVQGRCFRYTRNNPGLPAYEITKQIFTFEPERLLPTQIPTKSTPHQPWMTEDLVTCIKKHKCQSVDAAILKQAYGGREAVFAELEEEINQLCEMIQ